MIFNHIIIFIVTISLLMILYKIIRLSIATKELRIEISPINDDFRNEIIKNSKSSYFSVLFDEIIFMKSLWSYNRSIWNVSFPLHLSLYLSFFSIVVMILMNIIFYLSNQDLIMNLIPFLSGIVTINSSIAPILGVFSLSFLTLIKLRNNQSKISLSAYHIMNLYIYYLSLIGWLIIDPHFVPNFTSVFYYLYKMMPLPKLNVIFVIHLISLLVLILGVAFGNLNHIFVRLFNFRLIEIKEFYGLSNKNIYYFLNEKYNLKINWLIPTINQFGEKTWVGTIKKASNE